MKRSDAALDLVGIPRSHKDGFVRVAKGEKCVIISRAVGTAATTLIEDGHDTKGYRIHGKSCNWGPMAGFVLRDARLSKKGMAGRKSNEKAHQEALYDKTKVGWKASTQPVYISNARLQWLLENKDDKNRAFINPQPSHNPNQYVGTAQSPVDEFRIQYSLRKTMSKGKVVWAIWYRDFGSKDAYQPMRGMVNPHPTYPLNDYRNVVTGDYDLFAVWPHQNIYDPKDEDRRLAGMGPEMNNEQILNYEDTQVGNITNRIHLIAQLLNSRFDKGLGSSGRNMVHHSDEGGRPFIDDVDLPLIGFVPCNGKVDIWGIENLDDMKTFTLTCWEESYAIILNAAWLKDLGLVSAFRETQDWDKSWGTQGVKYKWPKRNK